MIRIVSRFSGLVKTVSLHGRRGLVAGNWPSPFPSPKLLTRPPVCATFLIVTASAGQKTMPFHGWEGFGCRQLAKPLFFP